MAIGEVLEAVAETRIRGLAMVVEHAGRTAAAAGVETGDALRAVAEVLGRELGGRSGAGSAGPAFVTADDVEVRGRAVEQEAVELADRLRAARARVAAADEDASVRLFRAAGR